MSTLGAASTVEQETCLGHGECCLWRREQPQSSRILAAYWPLLSRHCQQTIFSDVFEVLRVQDQSQILLQALKLNFPSKICDLDAYLSRYVTFRRFCRVYCPGTAKRRIKEAVIKSAASAASLGFAGERPMPRRPHAGSSSWHSPANFIPGGLR